jgi:hypothetical protein
MKWIASLNDDVEENSLHELSLLNDKYNCMVKVRVVHNRSETAIAVKQVQEKLQNEVVVTEEVEKQ